MRPALALIGRSPACRIHLDDESTSRFEAVLVRTPAGPWVASLGGRAGLTVNERPASASPLRDGDLLGIGTYQIRVGMPSRRLALKAPPGQSLTRISASRVRRSLPAPRGFESHSELAPVPTELPYAQPSATPTPPATLPADSMQIVMQMMGQWFGTLYHEQNTRVQEEIAHLVRLNRELAELYGRLLPREGIPEKAESPPEMPSNEAIAPPAEPPINPEAPPRPDPSESNRAPGEEANPEVHLELIRRIESLQDEQRGRWRRMARLVSGKS